MAESLRKQAEELARRCHAGPAEATLASLLTEQGKDLAGVEQEPAARTPAGSVGIWFHSYLTDSYVRSARHRAHWHRWADEERIPARSDKRRLVLVGESVARGYFYDPWLTPAQVLSDMLNQLAGEESFEVIDLACVNIHAPRLRQLLLQVPQLAPDGLILFAGNNWLPFGGLGPAQLAVHADVLGQGWLASHDLAANQLLPGLGRDMIDLCQQVSQGNRLPPVIVVPEFNLAGWQPSLARTLPYLPTEQQDRWWRLHREALAAMAAHDHERARELVAALQSIDQGLSSASHFLAGLSWQALGKRDLARTAFERARDAYCGVPVVCTPRCPAVVQETLARRARTLGMGVVDLRAVFAEHLQGAVPDQRLFLDYCHLNQTGLRIAMAHTAAAIWRNHAPAGFDHDEVVDRCLAMPRTLDNTREASAHLLAALHNAHLGQPLSTVRTHVDAALRLDGQQALAWIKNLLDFHNRRAPRWLCSSFARLTAMRNFERALYPAVPHLSDKFNDELLNQALVAALQDAGISGPDELTPLLIAENVPEGETLDLLTDQYHATSYHDRHGHAFGPAPAYYRAATPHSQFFLPAATNACIRLDIHYRIPTGQFSDTARVMLSLNGQEIATLPCAQTWHGETVLLPAEHVCAGSNTLNIAWPPQSFAWLDYARELVSCWKRGAVPQAAPDFGHIHSLTARLPGSGLTAAPDGGRETRPGRRA